MEIKLSEHFTYKKLLKFVLPSIVMMIFTSIYSVVDGLFVSNYAGKTALASINLIFPFLMGISALGFMIGTGGSAIVGKTLGEGKREEANEYFSLLVYVTVIFGVVLTIVGIIFLPSVARLLGARGELLENCIMYGRVTFISMPAFMLQNVFQSFFVAGENGVAAYGTIMYVNFIFVAIFIGYSIGSAPIISFHYGAGNHDELKNMFKKVSVLWQCGVSELQCWHFFIRQKKRYHYI